MLPYYALKSPNYVIYITRNKCIVLAVKASVIASKDLKTKTMNVRILRLAFAHLVEGKIGDYRDCKRKMSENRAGSLEVSRC
jgi:hypothetical protein